MSKCEVLMLYSLSDTTGTDRPTVTPQPKKRGKFKIAAEKSGTSTNKDKFHTYQLAEPVEDAYVNSENIQRFGRHTNLKTGSQQRLLLHISLKGAATCQPLPTLCLFYFKHICNSF